VADPEGCQSRRDDILDRGMSFVLGFFDADHIGGAKLFWGYSILGPIKGVVSSSSPIEALVVELAKFDARSYSISLTAGAKIQPVVHPATLGKGVALGEGALFSRTLVVNSNQDGPNCILQLLLALSIMICIGSAHVPWRRASFNRST